MAGADQPAAEYQDDVEVDGAQCGIALHQTELVEDDADHDGHEQLEEALDPQVDDPEPPSVDDREVRRPVVEQGRQVEYRDRRRGDQEEHHERSALPVTQDRPYAAPQQDEPEHQPEREQDLPGAADLEILPALIAEPPPGSTQPLQDA